ncbi:MAG TPA: STAS domain-containing protein [Acidimicrobiia bacterium]|nr:STAS domain-containing protein [Acidimicrobiia bacterium]
MDRDVEGSGAEVFSVTVADGSPPVVKLVGELDLATVHVFRGALDELPGDVVLDCTALDFVDSSGLSAIVDEHRVRTGSGHRLTLRGLSATTYQTFELTGLHRELDIEPPDHG